MKDWVGDGRSVFVCNGASNHSTEEREVNDYYATEPKAVELLLEKESFEPNIWECACGGGHMSEVLKANGYNVKSSDVIDRGYSDTEIIDFLKVKKSDVENDTQRDIITNPPYKYAQQFVEKAIELLPNDGKVAMFLKLTFLEGKGRKELFKKYPPKVVYVFSSRLQCAKSGDFEKYGNSVRGAVAYAWFVWQKGFNGYPIIKWI